MRSVLFEVGSAPERVRVNTICEMKRLFTGDSWVKITTDAPNGLAGQLVDQLKILLQAGAKIWARIHENDCYVLLGCLGVTLGGATLMANLRGSVYIVFKQDRWITINHGSVAYHHIPYTIVPPLIRILVWTRPLLQPNTTPPSIPQCDRFSKDEGGGMSPRLCVEWAQMRGVYQLVDGALLVPVTDGNRMFAALDVDVRVDDLTLHVTVATDGDQHWFAAPTDDESALVLLPHQLGQLQVPSRTMKVRFSPFDTELIGAVIASASG